MAASIGAPRAMLNRVTSGLSKLGGVAGEAFHLVHAAWGCTRTSWPDSPRRWPK
jgi:hypothetical protein